MSEIFPEWVIFLIKNKLLWATYFLCETYVVLLTYPVQILQKLQVKPNQQHLFVIDLFRASKNHLECQSNITIDLPLLFPSHSKLKSSLHWHSAVSKSQGHWSLMEEKNPTHHQHYTSESPPSPSSQNRLSYKKKWNILAFFQYSKTFSSSVSHTPEPHSVTLDCREHTGKQRMAFKNCCKLPQGTCWHPALGLWWPRSWHKELQGLLRHQEAPAPSPCPLMASTPGEETHQGLNTSILKLSKGTPSYHQLLDHHISYSVQAKDTHRKNL